jgi:Domain of unknown function DUF11
MRRLCLLFVLPGLFGCPAEVVLGRYRLNGGADASIALVDAGLEDASVAFDAGAADAGVLDAGAPFADLQVSLSGPMVLEQSEFGTYVLRVANVGALSAASTVVVFAPPVGFNFQSAGTCALSSNMVTCDFGDLDGGSTSSANVTLGAGGEYGWGDFTLSASSSTPDRTPSDNTLLGALAATPPGTPTVTVVPQFIDVTGCRGTNIAAFSQCVSGSTMVERYSLLADGGLTDDAGYVGVWGQSGHQRNLAFRFHDAATGQQQAGFVGGSVSAQCFEGPIDLGGVPYVGAWRGCVQ